MVRGKTIGALSEDTKTEFQIIALKDGWKNYDVLMRRMLDLYVIYNREFEEKLKKESEESDS